MRLLAATEAVVDPMGGSTAGGPGVDDLVRQAPPSMSGPIGAEVLRELPTPPLVGLPVAAQVLWFSLRQFGFVFRQRARLGDVSERPQHRNVTMIPARGGRVVMRRRRG